MKLKEKLKNKRMYLIGLISSATVFIVGIIFIFAKNFVVEKIGSILLALSASFLPSSLIGFFIESSDSNSFREYIRRKTNGIVESVEDYVKEMVFLTLESYSPNFEKSLLNTVRYELDVISSISKKKDDPITYYDEKSTDKYIFRIETNLNLCKDSILKLLELIDGGAKEIIQSFVEVDNLKVIVEKMEDKKLFPSNDPDRYVVTICELSKSIAYAFKFIYKFNRPISEIFKDKISKTDYSYR